MEKERKVSTEEGQKLYEDLEMDYFIESSAKTAFNSEKIFIQAAKLLFNEYETLKNMKESKEKNKILENIQNIENKKKRGCCS